MANNASKHYVDPGWPDVPDGAHAVNEMTASRQGPLSPFGEDMEFPLPVEDLPYAHPHTVINR